VHDDADPPAIDAETLEKLRRGLPLRMDRLGRFTFEGDVIGHPGVDRLFRQGLDLSDGGEVIVRVGSMWAYLQLDDLPLRVLAVSGTPDAGPPRLHLDDGRTLPLAPATLWEEPEQGLRCAVPSRHVPADGATPRSLPARFTNAAMALLEPWLELDESAPPRLRVGPGRSIPIPCEGQAAGD